MPELPRLHVRTRVLADPGALLWHSDATVPQLWLRGEDGLVGRGVAWRGEYRGVHRILDAGADWSRLLELAVIDDELQVPGSGLLAFGAFTFHADSSATSLLQVPAQLLGRYRGTAFATRIHVEGGTQHTPAGPGASAAVQSGQAPEEALAAAVPPGPPATTELHVGRMDAHRHRAAVRGVLERIHRGELRKAVIARELRGRIPLDADRRHIAARLHASYPDCWTYAVDGLIGASPETLVRVSGGEVSARVLAGSAPRGAAAGEDAAASQQLRASGKNLLEHRLAVDSATAALPGLRAGEPFVLQLPGLLHLATDLAGALPADRNVLDLVAALHPTAAVGGTPTDAAVAAIAELEPFDRRRYAGPVGWLDARGNGEWAIALRGAEIEQDGAVTAYAGGGVVAGSDPEAEFAETEWKFPPIRAALSASEPLP